MKPSSRQKNLKQLYISNKSLNKMRKISNSQRDSKKSRLSSRITMRNLKHQRLIVRLCVY